ncbi:transposase [Komagataeibacter diospyri]|uniref:Insertion element IS402-like domain-containing protein n=1 Tax=Komagataeibacter diospyri TaxID=1932662 RepID=A0A4P5NM75_9PROT|nr:transposase [Komagataeibacter diospyri]GCE82473.1 hypothetical protein MSKU9_0614 [Komagataeibacter diospyri]
MYSRLICDVFFLFLVGGTAADNCQFIEAVLYRYRAGIPWRDQAVRFGDWKNVHRRLRRWCESGVKAV